MESPEDVVVLGLYESSVQRRLTESDHGFLEIRTCLGRSKERQGLSHSLGASLTSLFHD